MYSPIVSLKVVGCVTCWKMTWLTQVHWFTSVKRWRKRKKRRAKEREREREKEKEKDYSRDWSLGKVRLMFIQAICAACFSLFYFGSFLVFFPLVSSFLFSLSFLLRQKNWIAADQWMHIHFGTVATVEQLASERKRKNIARIFSCSHLYMHFVFRLFPGHPNPRWVKDVVFIRWCWLNAQVKMDQCRTCKCCMHHSLLFFFLSYQVTGFVGICAGAT